MAGPAHASVPAARPLRLPERRDLFYGGAWHPARSGRRLETTSPSTGESLGDVAYAEAADAEAAIAAARIGFETWRRVPPLERARMLRRMAQVLRDNAEELAMIDAADCGNPFARDVGDASIAAAQTRLLRGARHRDEGRLDPDGTGRDQLLGARTARRRGAHRSLQSSRSCSWPARRRPRSPPATP